MESTLHKMEITEIEATPVKLINLTYDMAGFGPVEKDGQLMTDEAYQESFLGKEGLARPLKGVEPHIKDGDFWTVDFGDKNIGMVATEDLKFL